MLYVQLVITEDTVHVLLVILGILIKEDVQKFLKSYLMLAVRKIENAKVSMLVLSKMDTAHAEILVLSTNHVQQMLDVRFMMNFLFVS